MTKPTIYLTLIITLSAILTGCSGPAGEGGAATPTPYPTPVVPSKPTYAVQRGDVTQEVQFTARVAPTVQEELFFRVDGRVRGVYFDEGNPVRAGEVIADLEYLDDLERQLASDQLALRRAEIYVENAQIALDAFLAEQPSAEMVLGQAQQTLVAARRAFRQAESCYKALKNSSTADIRETAQSEYRIAKAQLDAAEAAWQRVQENPVPAEYEAQRTLLENDLELAQIAYEETKIGVADIEKTIADAQLTAPFDGVLSTLHLSDGRAVNAFKPYAVVADMSQLELSANLSTDVMQNLEVGMAVTAQLASRPGEVYTGTIRYLPYGLPPDAENKEKTTRIALNVDFEEAGLKVGDLMRVTIVLKHHEDVLWLPPQAIRTFEGRKFVVVQENGYQQRVDVKIGAESDDRVEIISGLEEGQVVIAP